MRQLLYVSDSLIGQDTEALDQLTLQARSTNALDGITGLLWTDGKRFAQVLEGDERAVAELIGKIRLDPRHGEFRIVQDSMIDERQFGDWSMHRPSTDDLGQLYEQRMLRQLDRLDGDLSKAFREVILGSRPQRAA